MKINETPLVKEKKVNAKPNERRTRSTHYTKTNKKQKNMKNKINAGFIIEVKVELKCQKTRKVYILILQCLYKK